MKYIKIGIILVSFCFLFWILNILLAPKYMTSLVEGSMISEYYSEEKNHDVIFIGDCEVYANFSPMVIYENTGITSYIRGSSQQLIWQSYGILKETLHYEIPKAVVFNVNAMRYDKPISEAYNRLTLDKMKWSQEKVQMIRDSMLEDESFLSYVFPILRYHSRFSSLTSEDINYLFRKKKNTFNGFLVNQNVKPYTNFPTPKKLPNYQFSNNVYDYLEKIFRLCKENGIELILIKAPSLYPYWYQEYDEQIVKFAQSHQIEYYNFINDIDIIGIDYKTDTYDGGLHLNLNGATKLSTYFSEILKEKHNLTDQRTNKVIDQIYQKKVSEYYNYINERS